jgi:formamidopyrimidine-DNA glycosylase
MPERPDLEYAVPILDRELRGLRITSVSVRKPVVLRLAAEGTPAALLVGRMFQGVTRRGHFVCLALEPESPVELVVAPMLAGRLVLAQAADKAPGDLALALGLSDGRELRYRDDVQMGKVYVLPRGAQSVVPGLATIGIDVLSKAFTREAFRALAKKRRDQAKVFLMDKAALDSMGNAYADEVLWAAQVHPKTQVRSLDAAALDRLHDAIVDVLGAAREEIARRRPPLDQKLRDFLKVRGRAGQPCPRCGSTLRSAGVHGHDSEFCPQCQPDARGSGLVDWRKVPPKA